MLRGTGGGPFWSYLLREPGASSCLLEGVVPYDKQSCVEFLRRNGRDAEGVGFCSPEMVRQPGGSPDPQTSPHTTPLTQPRGPLQFSAPSMAAALLRKSLAAALLRKSTTLPAAAGTVPSMAAALLRN